MEENEKIEPENTNSENPVEELEVNDLENPVEELEVIEKSKVLNQNLINRG